MNQALIPERSFRRLLMAGILWPSVLIILFCASLFLIGVQAGGYRDRYLAAQMQDAAARELRTDLLDMETGVRGYLLTGENVYLEPTDNAKRRFTEDMNRFTSSSTNEPDTHALAMQIREQADEWILTSEQLESERRAGRATQDKMLTTSKLQFDAIRHEFDQLLSSNSARIAIRSAEWDQERRNLLVTLVCGAIIVVIALTYVVIFLMRKLSQIYHDALDANEKSGQQIRDLNSELEQRVRERTSDLTRANQELEAFSYSVSHDLRAPLRSIASFSAILQQDVGSQLDVESADNLKRIRAAATKMTTLIDALLKFSRIARSEMTRSHVDVTQMVESIIADIRRENEKEVNAVVQQGMTAEADLHLVRVVFENLLENAWKFSGKGDHPKVEVGKNDGAFFVRDNGVGFEQQYVEKVFLPFERLHKEGDFPGTGIGLATTKRIVERHGGKIWAEGRPGEGATFFFKLESEE